MHSEFVASVPKFGDELGSKLFEKLDDRGVTSLRAVSGYVGVETIIRLTETVRRRPELGVSLVVGMAAREGIAQRSYDALGNLSSRLRENQKRSGDPFSNVYWYFSGEKGTRDRGLHAKAYRLAGQSEDSLIVGSSNFSMSGLSPRGNLEINLIQHDRRTIEQFDRFFSQHLEDGFSFVPFEKVDDFPIKGKKSKRAEKLKGGLLKVHRPKGFKSLPHVDIDLAQDIEKKTRSSLNVCFGRGRWSRATGIVRPREYFEVEIIVPNSVNSSAVYPKGDFLVTTSDGYSFEARTQGSSFKNLRSKHDLAILGLWIKGLLQDAGSLDGEIEELVTSETFSHYGNSILRLYQKSPSEIVLHFPRNSNDL